MLFISRYIYLGNQNLIKTYENGEITETQLRLYVSSKGKIKNGHLNMYVLESYSNPVKLHRH